MLLCAQYANIAHTDATVRSIHSRCKDQVLGTTETVVKYQGVYPKGWGDIRPSLEWQERLFRSESSDHDSPAGRGGVRSSGSRSRTGAFARSMGAL